MMNKHEALPCQFVPQRSKGFQGVKIVKSQGRSVAKISLERVCSDVETGGQKTSFNQAANRWLIHDSNWFVFRF